MYVTLDSVNIVKGNHWSYDISSIQCNKSSNKKMDYDTLI